MKRKSVDLNTIDNNKETKELYIVMEKKPYTVEDFLPDYAFKYDRIRDNTEAESIIRSLTEFIKSNDELVLENYNSENTEAVQEGFKRATAIAELFIRSMYIGDDMEDG